MYTTVMIGTIANDEPVCPVPGGGHNKKREAVLSLCKADGAGMNGSCAIYESVFFSLSY